MALLAVLLAVVIAVAVAYLHPHGHAHTGHGQDALNARHRYSDKPSLHAQLDAATDEERIKIMFDFLVSQRALKVGAGQCGGVRAPK